MVIAFGDFRDLLWNCNIGAIGATLTGKIKRIRVNELLNLSKSIYLITKFEQVNISILAIAGVQKMQIMTPWQHMSGTERFSRNGQEKIGTCTKKSI